MSRRMTMLGRRMGGVKWKSGGCDWVCVHYNIEKVYKCIAMYLELAYLQQC